MKLHSERKWTGNDSMVNRKNNQEKKLKAKQMKQNVFSLGLLTRGRWFISQLSFFLFLLTASCWKAKWIKLIIFIRNHLSVHEGIVEAWFHSFAHWFTPSIMRLTIDCHVWSNLASMTAMCHSGKWASITEISLYFFPQLPLTKCIQTLPGGTAIINWSH